MPAKGTRLPMHIRNVNPKIFLNYDLADAEATTGQPIFKALVGLWCHADREGRFEWNLRKLQVLIYPYTPTVDLTVILDVLLKQDVVRKYEVNGHTYGWLVTFKDYQYLANKEPDSILPPCPGALPESSDVTVEVVPRNHAGALVSEAETKSEAEGRRTTLKTEAEYGGTPQKSAQSKHSAAPASLSDSQSSAQASSAQPGDEKVWPSTIVKFWKDNIPGACGEQNIKAMCDEQDPREILEVLRWAWGTSTYWFKKPGGEIQGTPGFRRAYGAMLKQYRAYRFEIQKAKLHPGLEKTQKVFALAGGDDGDPGEPEDL
ncbi:MAG: hypothetical protein WCC04_05630 [Terriglobales bacterium]